MRLVGEIRRFTTRSTESDLALHWRHNGHDGVSNHQPHAVFYSTVYSDADLRKHQSSASLPAQRASNTENVSIWWRHHVDVVVERNLVWQRSTYQPTRRADNQPCSTLYEVRVRLFNGCINIITAWFMFTHSFRHPYAQLSKRNDRKTTATGSNLAPFGVYITEIFVWSRLLCILGSINKLPVGH